MSVILLPGSVVAGVMGMNFQVGLFQHAWLFGVVVAGIVLIILFVAKRRGWI